MCYCIKFVSIKLMKLDLSNECMNQLGHSMSDHPKKMKFETAPPQILIKLYTLPLCDYNRRPVVF